MGAAEKIRIILIKKNMKLKELAEKLGYKPNNLSNKLKNDNFTEQEIKNIAKALGCDCYLTFIIKDTGEEI